jgi:hypothetical protein
MRIPQVSDRITADRIKQAPAHALRAVFAGIGQLLVGVEKLRKQGENGANSPPPADRSQSAAVRPPAAEGPPRARRSLDQTGNVRLLSAADLADEVAAADDPPAAPAVPETTAPAETPPTEAAPAKKTAAEPASAENVPAEPASADNIAAEAALVADAVGEDALGEEAPPEEALVEDTLADAALAEDALVADTPADATPADAIPAGATPAGDTPAGDTPAGDTPAGDTPADAAPADAAPADAAPADAAPADAAPADHAPAEDAGLPVPNYDALSVPSLRARLRNLDTAQLRVLVDYEQSHAARADVVAMFGRRIAKLAAGG